MRASEITSLPIQVNISGVLVKNWLRKIQPVGHSHGFGGVGRRGGCINKVRTAKNTTAHRQHRSANKLNHDKNEAPALVHTNVEKLELQRSIAKIESKPITGKISQNTPYLRSVNIFKFKEFGISAV